MEELPTDLKEISAEEVSVILFWWRSHLQIRRRSVLRKFLVEELPTDLKEISAEEVSVFLF